MNTGATYVETLPLPTFARFLTSLVLAIVRLPLKQHLANQFLAVTRFSCHIADSAIINIDEAYRRVSHEQSRCTAAATPLLGPLVVGDILFS